MSWFDMYAVGGAPSAPRPTSVMWVATYGTTRHESRTFDVVARFLVSELWAVAWETEDPVVIALWDEFSKIAHVYGGRPWSGVHAGITYKVERVDVYDEEEEAVEND